MPLQHCPTSTLMLSLSDATRKELTLCKRWSWALMELPMGMEPIFLISTLKTLTLRLHLKLTWPQQETQKWDSTRTYTVAEKYVYLFLVLGEEVPVRIGTRRYRHYSKCSSPSNQLSWQKTYTLMSQDLKGSKVPYKAKRRMRHTQT